MSTYRFAAVFLASTFLAYAEVTPREFYDAIRRNDLPRLQSYVDGGAPVDLRDGRGSTPLMHATVAGSLEAMRLLLKAGANVNAKNGLDASALVWGAADPQRAKLLLDAGADVNVRTKLGRTPLLMAAGHQGSGETVRLLLAKGADTTVADVRGNTALLEAARVDDMESLRLLAERKVDLNAGDFAGVTALGHAAAHSNLEAVRLLIAKGSNPNTALKRTIEMKNGIIAASYITALMSAGPSGSIEVVKALLDAGADVKLKDVRGMTPLMYAVAADTANPRVVRLLLDHGSDPAAKDAAGESVLDWAKKFGDPATIRMLGGDVSKTARATKPAAQPAIDVRKAIGRSLPLLESTAVEYFKQSGCVGCHHQDLISQAVSAASRKGLPVNTSLRQERMSVLRGELLGTREALLQNVYISVDGNAYALLSMAEQDYPADEITDTLASLFASAQTQRGDWTEFPGVRPPLEASPFVTAAFAARSMVRYAIPARQADFEERVVRARRWLSNARPHAAYEQYFRLMGLKWSGADRPVIDSAVASIRHLQRPDGGFPQSVHLASDAFGTASALCALREAGVPTTDPAFQRGVRYLLAGQKEDGSWHVASRSPKFQPYFQSGFPYGHDQWISTAATSLAVKALAEALEPATVRAASR